MRRGAAGVVYAIYGSRVEELGAFSLSLCRCDLKESTEGVRDEKTLPLTSWRLTLFLSSNSMMRKLVL